MIRKIIKKLKNISGENKCNSCDTQFWQSKNIFQNFTTNRVCMKPYAMRAAKNILIGSAFLCLLCWLLGLGNLELGINLHIKDKSRKINLRRKNLFND